MNVLMITVVGLLAGWLVNIVADTMPEKRSVRTTWYWLIYQLPPWLLQRWGLELSPESCPRRPWRYSCVCFTALALGWLSYLRLGWQIEGLIVTIESWFFLAVAIIDLEHRRVLNRMLLAALPAIFLFNLLLGWANIPSSLLGAAVGFGIFLLIALIVPGGMGMGDVKLAGLIGLATGLSGVLIALYVGILTGGLAGVAILVYHRFRRGQTMAYAPYLVFGAWFVLYDGMRLLSF